MRKLHRREIVLLVAAAVALVVWAARPGTDASLPPLPGKAKARDEKPKEAPAKAPVVMLAMLKTESVVYDPGGRDLFQYAQRPPSAAEVRRMRLEAEEAERLRKEAERQARELAERQAAAERARQEQLINNPLPPPRPRPPQVTVRYLGCMGPRGDRIAFFDHNKELIMAKEGETFLKDFRVVKIGYETVTVGWTAAQFKDDPPQEIPMSRTR